jgi:hypothetical protein
MTEQEWLTCADPEAMLKPLRGRVSDRKLWLFAVACAWERGVLVGEEQNRRYLAALVRFADGKATRRKAQAARRAAYPTWGQVSILDFPDPGLGAWETAERAIGSGWLDEYRYPQRVVRRNAAQAGLARCVFGNPFRPSPAAPDWATPDVTAVAHAAYEEGFPDSGFLDPVRLSVLADALEDAGCDRDDLLAHLRGPGPHARGCWAVDACLGQDS